jgi:ribose transport system substrate-binding protein
MKKLMIGAAAAAIALAFGTHATPAAAKPYVFALVPKNTNNPFFDQARDGCKKAEKESNGAFECLYIGPDEHGGGDEEVAVVADLIAKKVDGIATSPANAAAMGKELKEAKKAGIPVLTFDADLLPEDKDLRIAFIGTHNYEIGTNLAKMIQAKKPKGGTICIQSGGAAAANHNERIQGIRDQLSGTTSKEAPGTRLTGQNGWTEVDGCPLYTNDDFTVALQQEQDILGKYPKLDAFVPTGGFGEFLEQAYKKTMTPYKAKIASGEIVIPVADTLAMQIEELKDGLATGNVGQRPFEMGYLAMKALYDIKQGKPGPKDPTYTGLDVVTPENVNSFGK